MKYGGERRRIFVLCLDEGWRGRHDLWITGDLNAAEYGLRFGNVLELLNWSCIVFMKSLFFLRTKCFPLLIHMVTLPLQCPFCESNDVGKNGTNNGKQLWLWWAINHDMGVLSPSFFVFPFIYFRRDEIIL